MKGVATVADLNPNDLREPVARDAAMTGRPADNGRAADSGAVRDDFIPKEDYTSRSFAELERERLWPRVWQMVCREEELRAPGAYVTYEICDESIVVVRTARGDIKAHHNVCPHRGNQFVTGRGSMARIVCSFHGWKWDLDGACLHVKDAEDFAGCPNLAREDLGLVPVQVDCWGGFVFINLDRDAPPLREFLAPVPHYLDCVQFEGMRIGWHQTVSLKGNWKTALESFMESYHVFTTHPQLVPVFDEASYSRALGLHGMHGYPPSNRPLGAPSPRTGLAQPEDLREGVIKVFADIADQTGGVTAIGNISGRAAKEVERLRTEVPATASPEEVLGAALQFMAEAAIRDGATWPTLTPEQFGDIGVDWNLFPNMVLVFGLDASLVFRARPDGDDPDRCIFDMWGMIRTSDENAPQYEHRDLGNWRDHVDEIPSLLVQDLRNIEKIQRGMRSVAFRGSRPSPVQEQQVSNLHKGIHRYLFD